MITVGQAINQFEVDVLDHLDRDALIPVLSGPQAQGDIIVIPVAGPSAATPLPTDGVAVVRGENGGNTHLLLGDGPVFWDAGEPGAQTLGLLTVGAFATGYLAHPEHAYAGVAAGTYVIRRQREQADEIRLVAD